MCEQRPKAYKEEQHGTAMKATVPVILCSKPCALELCHFLSLASIISLLDTPILDIYFNFLITIGISRNKYILKKLKLSAKANQLMNLIDHFFLFLSLPLDEKIEPNPNRLFAGGTFNTGLIRTPLIFPYDP